MLLLPFLVTLLDTVAAAGNERDEMQRELPSGRLPQRGMNSVDECSVAIVTWLKTNEDKCTNKKSSGRKLEEIVSSYDVDYVLKSRGLVPDLNSVRFKCDVSKDYWKCPKEILNEAIAGYHQLDCYKSHIAVITGENREGKAVAQCEKLDDVDYDGLLRRDIRRLEAKKAAIAETTPDVKMATIEIDSSQIACTDVLIQNSSVGSAGSSSSGGL